MANAWHSSWIRIETNTTATQITTAAPRAGPGAALPYSPKRTLVIQNETWTSTGTPNSRKLMRFYRGEPCHILRPRVARRLPPRAPRA